MKQTSFFSARETARPVTGVYLGIEITDDLKNNTLYDGSEDKFGITVGNTNYLVKLQKKDWRNVKSEVVASNFITQCGVPCHETTFGIYEGQVCAICKDFTKEFGKLYSLGAISSSYIETDQANHDYFLKDVEYELKNITGLDFNDAMNSFWKMYIMDAVLGNTDRHKGNWGFCKKKREGLTGVESEVVYQMSPIYDNGASLFPRNHNLEITEEWMRERVLKFPNSKLMINDKRERASYLETVATAAPKEILEWAKQLDVVMIMKAVCRYLKLGDLETSYYVTIVFYRWNTIVRGNKFKWIGMLR